MNWELFQGWEQDPQPAGMCQALGPVQLGAGEEEQQPWHGAGAPAPPHPAHITARAGGHGAEALPQEQR